MTRLICASIGLAWDREKNTLNAPIYDVSSGAIVAYGGGVLDWLLRQGAIAESLWSFSDLIGDLWDILPKEEDVAAAADSFLEDGRAPGCAGTTDSQAVAAPS
ncbi:MAG TPA: hypothetical protein EYN66_14770 [Myxococcales bacterium]|nr:hypothetical protein [Myxococcales bacterium]